MIQYFPIVTGSLTVLGNINVSGSITTSGSITISGSITSASFATSASNATNAISASYANNLTVAGTLTAQTIVVQTVTSSIVYSSGSNIFGNNIANTQTFTGSVNITGSQTTYGNLLNPNSNFQTYGSASFGVSTWGLSIGNGGVSANYYRANDHYFQNGAGTQTTTIASSGATTITATSAVALTANGGNSSDGTVAKFARGGSEKNFYISATNNQYINLGTEGDFRFRVGCTVDQPYATGTTALFVSSSGNVGVGTSVAPAVNGLGLAIYASDYPRITLRNSTSGDTTGDGLQIALVGANVQYDLAESGYQMWTTGGTERMRITSAGNVLIGTTTAYQNLTILKNQNADTAIGIYNQTDGTASSTTLRLDNGSYNGQLNLYANSFTTSGTAGANILRLYTDGPGGMNFSCANQHIRFYTSPSEVQRLTILYGGNVGISRNNPSARLEVQGVDKTSSTYTFVAYDSSTDVIFGARNDGLINTGLRTYSPYNFSTSGRNAVINSSGELGYLSSTRESKANIESIKSIDFINQLNPVQFNYRKKNSETNEYTNELYDNINYGFIADEVEKVNKDLVFYKSDGTTLAGVEYNNMIAILTKALQELNTKFEEYKATHP